MSEEEKGVEIDGVGYHVGNPAWWTTRPQSYYTFILNQKADLAKELVCVWADTPDRTKEQVVLGACEIADALFEEFRKRGWILDIPAPSCSKPEEITDDEE